MIVADSNTVPMAGECQTALLAAMESVETMAAARWVGRFREPTLPPLRAEVADGFLNLSAELGQAGLPSRWDLLKANGSFGGHVKFSALSPAAGAAVFVSAEIPQTGRTDLRLRLGNTCRAVQAALSLAEGAQEELAAAAAEDTSPDLRKLCEEAGWECSSRRTGSCAVALGCRRGAHTALITAPAGRLRVSVELASWETLTNPSREALAAVLLAANRLLRFARAVATEDASGGVAELEVVFDPPANATNPAELACALEALSVGAELCAPLVDILQHEEAAKHFLAVQGGPCDRERSQHTKERKI